MKIETVMTSDKLIEKLKEYNLNSKNLDGLWGDKRQLVKSDLGPIKHKHISGGEDEGSDYVDIYYFPKYNIYLKASGYYTSYDGVSDWEPLKEVFPKEVTRVEFFGKNVDVKDEKIDNFF